MAHHLAPSHLSQFSALSEQKWSEGAGWSQGAHESVPHWLEEDHKQQVPSPVPVGGTATGLAVGVAVGRKAVGGATGFADGWADGTTTGSSPHQTALSHLAQLALLWAQ